MAVVGDGWQAGRCGWLRHRTTWQAAQAWASIPPVTAAAPPRPAAMPMISAVVGALLLPGEAAGASVVVRGGLDAAGVSEPLAVPRGRRSAGGAAVPGYTASTEAWLTGRPADRKQHGGIQLLDHNQCGHIAATPTPGHCAGPVLHPPCSRSSVASWPLVVAASSAACTAVCALADASTTT